MMPEINPKVVIKTLAEMQEELTSVKGDVDNMQNDLGEVSPEELHFNPEEAPPEDKEKMKSIKTPEDAKKVLNEALRDLQNVADNIDAICGQAEQEVKEAAMKRMNDRYASNMNVLITNASKAIDDAKDAMSHWAFLLSSRSIEKSISNPDLKQAANTIKEVGKFSKLLEGLGFIKKDATAVPPTGAKFTGDKFPAKGDPAKIELNTWHKGQTKFDADKSFEDKRPNPAIDNRLTDVEYNRFGDDGEFVNASFIFDKKNPYNSYWDIFDAKNRKRVVASFNNAPAVLGPKTNNGLRSFGSAQYGEKLKQVVASEGLDVVKAQLNGKFIPIPDKLARIASTGDMSGVRKYFADAYGDKEYAKKLTSTDNPSQLPIDYTPEYDSPNDKKDTTKDGPGTISSQKSRKVDPEVVRARARNAVNLARRFSAAGSIPFTKQAIAIKANELMQLSDSAFLTVEATLKQMPIVNVAALKEGHLPDTETGIVGNSSTGVSDPKSRVSTEDLSEGVKGDAKIAKQANLVPQVISSENTGLPLSSYFTTTQKQLAEKGVDTNLVRRPTYRM